MDIIFEDLSDLSEEEYDNILWEEESRRRESLPAWPYQGALGILDGTDALALENKTDLKTVANSKTMTLYYGRPTSGYGSLEFGNMELLSSAIDWAEINWSPNKPFTSRESIAANLLILFASRSVS